ncbi:MAG: replication-associated recombination protein A [Deltaproteobacteria bacterium]|nr:replication-associated recombination protein A [Deltaproteobacteria bacterium]
MNPQSLSHQAPLAERMRPKRLSDFVGQSHLLGPGKILSRAFEKDQTFSMILWGPPGCGKTTLAFLMSQQTQKHFEQISAVLSGVKEIREIVENARKRLQSEGRGTLLFIDEIHRFNKAQQDALLPHVEKGTVLLIGSTTENPSFEVIRPLISRTKVLTLKPLGPSEIEIIVSKALTDREEGLGQKDLALSKEALSALCGGADGDGRIALNTLEIASQLTEQEGKREISLDHVMTAFQRRSIAYDRAGDEHYNVISAFIKSLRASDPDSAIYWLARMIEAGEDPLFIARRLVIFASEDIGNADPYALLIAVSTMQAVHFVGLPEGRINLAQAATYLAAAPKSNASYMAIEEAIKAVSRYGSLPVPLHFRNAPTTLMKDLGYGKGYRYPHAEKGALVNQSGLPEELSGTVFYRPSQRGYEKNISERLEKIKEAKKGTK